MLPTASVLEGLRVCRACILNRVVHSLLKEEDWVGNASRPAN